jgi:hypothetical protein
MSSFEKEGSILMDKKIFGRWVAKLVAHLLVTTAESRISQKYKMGDIGKGVANTL